MITNVATNGRRPDRLNLGVPLYEYPPASVGMIAGRVMPLTPVAKKNGEYPSVTRESFLRRREVNRGPGAHYSRDGYGLDMVTYNCQGFGFEVPIDKVQREVYVSEFDADLVAQQLINRVLLAEWEIRVAAEIFNAGASYWYSSTPALYTDVSTDWDSSSADILGDVESAKDNVLANCGIPANTMVLSSAHLSSLRTNTGLIAAFPGINALTSSIFLGTLAELFGIPNVLIGAGVYNAGNAGGSVSMTRIWSDDYCWIGVVPEGGDLSAPGAGRTYSWQVFGGGNEGGIEFDNYPENQTKSEVWRGEQWVDELVIDPYFGHLLKIDT